jgi:hypothetical protein
MKGNRIMSTAIKPKSLKELSEKLSKKNTHFVFEIKRSINFGTNRDSASRFIKRNRGKWLIMVKK